MSSVLAELNRVVNGLSVEKARQVLKFARSLEQPQITLPSDEFLGWSEEDLCNWSQNALRRLQAEQHDLDWGVKVENGAEISR